MEEANRENASIPSPYFHVEVVGFSKPGPKGNNSEGGALSWPQLLWDYLQAFSQRACAY